MTMRALSIRQPWAHAIVHHGKDLENRTRHNGYRGPLLIHASAGMTEEDYAGAFQFVRERGLPRLPDPGSLARGGIVGIVDMVDSVGADHPEAGSPWWMGPKAFVFANARRLPFIECKGSVCPLIWAVPEGVEARVRHHLALKAHPALVAN